MWWNRTTPNSKTCWGRFALQIAARNIIVIDVDRIIDSCGFGVPNYEYVGQRDSMSNWHAGKSEEEFACLSARKQCPKSGWTRRPGIQRVTAVRLASGAMLCALLLVSRPAAAEAMVEGVWLSGDGDGWIEIRAEGDDIVGTIAGSPNGYADDEPRVDELNPDPALRDRPLLGLVILSGFERKSATKWVDGEVYDPNSGRTYKCTLTLVDQNTIKLRGYVGVSLFGTYAGLDETRPSLRSIQEKYSKYIFFKRLILYVSW